MPLPYSREYTSANPLPIRADHESAYGEILAVYSKPVIQATPTYNVIPANWRSYTASGGNVAVTNQEFVCTTGTSVGGYGTLRSVRSVNYHAGLGSYGKFTGRFTAGVADSIQGIGFFNIGDTVAFGYYGTEFGILYQHGGFAEVRVITVTGASGGSTNLTLTLNTVEYTIPLTAGTTAHNAAEIAAWLTANQTVWSAKQNGSTVVIMALSDGAKSGTYSFSHGSATGSIAQSTAGVSKTTELIAQSDWNQDTAPWLDPTKGNMYAIQYNCGRYGTIEYFVLHYRTGRLIPVHSSNFTNDGSSPAFSNPSMRIGCFAASLGSTTNLTVGAGCMSGFSQGEPEQIRNPRAYSRVYTSLTTALTNIFTIRNREVFNGLPNQIEISPLLLTAFTESTKGITLGIYGNATIGGEQNFSYINENSLVAEVDTAGTTVTGGTPILEIVIPEKGTEIIDMTPLLARIPPTISFTFAAKVNSGAAADTGISVSWYEDV